MIDLLSGHQINFIFLKKIRGLRPWTPLGAAPPDPAVHRPSARHATRALLDKASLRSAFKFFAPPPVGKSWLRQDHGPYKIIVPVKLDWASKMKRSEYVQWRNVVEWRPPAKMAPPAAQGALSPQKSGKHGKNRVFDGKF